MPKANIKTLDRNPTSKYELFGFNEQGHDVNLLVGDILALAVGAGGIDTFSTLNGTLLTLPDGQVVDLQHTLDTDTDTFSTISGGIITFPEGDTVDLNSFGADTFATVNGNIITFADGSTRDITPVIDTDTDTFAILSGNTITFTDGQTLIIPEGGTDDQVASEVSINPIAGIIAANVQVALEQIKIIALDKEVRIDNYWFYPPNVLDPLQITNGQEFRGYPTINRYVTGIVLDATNFDIDDITKARLFTDIENFD